MYSVIATEGVGARTVQWVEETEQVLGLTRPAGMWVSAQRECAPRSVQAASVPGQ